MVKKPFSSQVTFLFYVYFPVFIQGKYRAELSKFLYFSKLVELDPSEEIEGNLLEELKYIHY